jgi:spore coat protein CotH
MKMNMRIRNVLSYIAFLFAAALLVNCENPLTAPLNPGGSSVQDAGRGTVVIHISDGNAGQRTLLPPAAAFSHYTWTFTSEGKAPVTRSSENTTVEVDLERGSWEVTVKGYVTIGGTPYLAAQGRKTITVTPGTPVNVSIIMTIAADPAGEAGTLSYDIDLSLETASLSKALLVLESLGGDYKTEIDLKEAGKRTGTLTLESGFYLLKVQLENGYQALGKTEVVHIYPNMETKAAYTFGSGDLTRLVPISGTAKIGGVPPGKAGVFLYGDAEYDNLIAHTEIDPSNMTWQTVIPHTYDRVYFRLGIGEGTGFVFKAAGYEDIPKNGKAGITIPSPKILSFSIPAAETGLSADLTGAIDETRSTITLATQGWIENIASLKASFESTGTVTVGGTAQKSSVTCQDFRGDLVYRVTTEDNATKDYTVVFESPQATGLPVMKIDTQGNQSITSKETYVKTNIRILDPNNEANSFEHTGYKDEIRGRGNSTWSYPKKPYRLKFDKKIALFGLEKAKNWVLLANYIDPTLIMNTVAFELGRRIGLPYTNHYIPVEVFLNGVYQGSYLLTEQMQVGEGRVDIDEDEGFFVELDSYYDEEPKFRTDSYNLPVMIKSPEKLENPTGYDFVKTTINTLAAAMEADTFPDSGYRDLIDMDTFVDFLLINEIVRNNELGHPKSTYMYKDKGTAKISMGPLWDFDWAFGYTGSGHAYFTSPSARSSKHTFFQRFFADPVFTTQFKAHWNAHYTDITGMTAFIDEQAEILKKSQAENFKVWWKNDNINYNQEIEKMKTWWTERAAYLNAEINKY